MRRTPGGSNLKVRASVTAGTPGAGTPGGVIERRCAGGVVYAGEPMNGRAGTPAACLLALLCGLPSPGAAQDRGETRPTREEAQRNRTDAPERQSETTDAPARQAESPDATARQAESPDAQAAAPPFTEAVVVVGTRARPRSVVASTAPVDAIPGADFVRQGGANLADQLRAVAPSFNVNPQEDGDTAAVVRPAHLRALAPHHTLVLVNGKRRHRGAVIAWNDAYGMQEGAQGPDLSAIPAIALRQVEILRDGAAAQYGSDAIAGVMNLLLADDRSGGRLELRGGSFGAGDGGSYAVAGNAGLPLGRTGFLNLSAEYGNANSTSRSAQRRDAAALVAAGNPAVRDPAQVWGSPDVDDDLKLFANAGHLLDGGVQLYGHANYARKEVVSFFYWRNPNTRGGVFSNDGGRTLLVGDARAARGEGSAQCPTVTVTNDAPDQAALDRIAADPDCFSFRERFPGGFTPRFGGAVRDASAVAGARGQLAGGTRWDASVAAGSNTADFFFRNTVNASLGPETPDAHRPGSYRQQEIGVNVDLGHAVTDRVDLAAGAEWRRERFEIGLGDPDSWRAGPYAAQGFSVGSNGLAGFGPIAAGHWGRANAAVYGDVEVRGAAREWTLGGAGRVERFDDFGGAVNGKLAGRYPLAGAVALRGSLSTGFRAPTPGQQNAFNVSTVFDFARGDLFNVGTVPSTSAIAALRGGRPLAPERSVNYSAGAVVGGGPFTLTADYFRIDLSDRLILTRTFTLAPREAERLAADGVAAARGLSDFRFFTNDLETRTQGLDLVAAWTPAALGGRTAFSVVFNRTETAVTRVNPDLLSPDWVTDRVRNLEEAHPKTRWNVTVDHAAARWRLLGRLSYYGAWFDYRDGFVYAGKPIVDVEAAWPVSDAVTFALGGQNVLNTYPDENPKATDPSLGFWGGNLYPPSTPFGFSGGYYYGRIDYRWTGP